MGDNIVFEKSKKFALRIIRLNKYLCNDKKEFVLSKQILRSGTSIGANISEAIHAMSKKEFIAKMNISLKESAETEYWLELLKESEYITNDEFKSINMDCTELKSLLTAIIKSTKANMETYRM
jgi:four helix bundle protein